MCKCIHAVKQILTRENTCDLCLPTGAGEHLEPC